MKQFSQMMQQAQQMQKKLEDLQAKLDTVDVEGNSGGGMITATVSGKGELRKLKISPTLVDPNDVEMLEDLIVAAVRDAKAKADQHASGEMNALTGGMKLPGGMSLPF